MAHNLAKGMDYDGIHTYRPNSNNDSESTLIERKHIISNNKIYRKFLKQFTKKQHIPKHDSQLHNEQGTTNLRTTQVQI